MRLFLYKRRRITNDFPYRKMSSSAASMKKRVLVIVTNEAFIPINRESQQAQSPEDFRFLEAAKIEPNVTNKNYTGVDVYELAHIWQTLRHQMNCSVVFASPRGGPTAADPLSVEKMRNDEKLREKVNNDRELIDAMGHTYPIEWIKPEDYNCIVIPGCRGAMFDLPENRQLERIISHVYEKENGLICTIGHGAAALINVKKQNSNEFLVKNRKLTCFSDREEKEMQMDRILPFMIEDRLKERGARLEIAEPNKSKVVIDERLITAQNSQSIKEFVQQISENMKESKLLN